MEVLQEGEWSDIGTLSRTWLTHLIPAQRTYGPWEYQVRLLCQRDEFHEEQALTLGIWNLKFVAESLIVERHLFPFLPCLVVQVLDLEYFTRSFVSCQTLERISSMIPEDGPVASLKHVVEAVSQLAWYYSPTTDYCAYLRSEESLDIPVMQGRIDPEIFGPILRLLLRRSQTQGEQNHYGGTDT